jgi:hypothetical protein
MTILYRGPHGLVTHEVIATVHMRWSRVPVRDLKAIHIVRTRPDDSRLLLGLSALLIVLLTIPVVGWPAVVLSVVVLIATVVSLALARRRDRMIPWTLVADRSKVRTVLFMSTDQREFDQFCRALRRAVERQHDDAH